MAGETNGSTKTSLGTTLLVEVIKLTPQIAWLLVVSVALWWFYTPIKSVLENNTISKFGVAGIQIEFIQQRLQTAAQLRSQSIPKNLIGRIERTNPKLVDSSILWVDDNPPNNVAVRQALSSIGITVDTARNTEEAISFLKVNKYSLIISDLYRNEENKDSCFHEEIPIQPSGAGCYLMRKLKKYYEDQNQKMPPLIFYAGLIDPEWGTPVYAFGATSQVAELFHLILDALER